jgi:sodium/bile acid cotransporter 7
MALAQLLRQSKSIGTWATRKKLLLSKFAQAGILSMVLAGATNCGLRLAESDWSSLSGFPLMRVVALALHLVVFYVGFWLAVRAGFTRPQQIAVGISGSQKTLMVGLDIAISYFGGLAILPMVVYHFIQLTADTVIADRFRSAS